MKIKVLLKNKLRKAQLLGITMLLFLSVSFIYVEIRSTLALVIISIFVLGTVGVFAYMFHFLKCPKCNNSFGQVITSYTPLFKKESKLNYCPNCGANFNDDM